MNEPVKKLYKSQTDKVIAGVCGGIAEYFGIDPIIVRIAFVVLAFVNGIGILAYIILLIALPEPGASGDTAETVKANASKINEKVKEVVSDITDQTDSNSSKVIWGVIVLVAGLFFLMANFDIGFGFEFWKYWPILLIALGLYLLLKNKDGSSK